MIFSAWQFLKKCYGEGLSSYGLIISPMCNVSLMHKSKTLANLYKKGDKFSICLKPRRIETAQEWHHQ